MFGETALKTFEVPSEIQSEVTMGNVDISKRIEVNKPFVKTWQEGVDISKRIGSESDTKTEKKELEPRHENVDGHENYYDDNGKLYRVDNELIPSTEYEINTYKYSTDDQGRIVSASGKLHIKEKRDRLEIRDSKQDIAKGDQKATDDRGHLIGDQFDGTNGLENIVAQDSKINRGAYHDFENELAKEVADGKTVFADVRPYYSTDSRRPDAIGVTYSIDGKTDMRIFPNSSQEETK